MTTGLIRFAYLAATATIVGGTGLYVAVRDAPPALMVPAVLAGAGVYAIGRGVLALVRGTAVVRIGTTVDRGSRGPPGGRADRAGVRVPATRGEPPPATGGGVQGRDPAVPAAATGRRIGFPDPASGPRPHPSASRSISSQNIFS